MEASSEVLESYLPNFVIGRLEQTQLDDTLVTTTNTSKASKKTLAEEQLALVSSKGEGNENWALLRNQLLRTLF